MSSSIPPFEGARYETKYYLPQDVRTAVRNDLGRLLDSDLHHDSDAGYRVYSLYFDTPSRANYTEKIEGVPVRRRFRVRRYAARPDVSNLELKERIFNRHRKVRTLLSPEDYELLVAGRIPMAADPVVKAFWQVRATESLVPGVVVEYSRLAYLSRSERGVRVTLDSDLRARPASRFEDERRCSVQVLPRGVAILEFKWIDRLPFWMQFIVQKYSLRNFAISKYCLGVDALSAQGRIARVQSF